MNEHNPNSQPEPYPGTEFFRDAHDAIMGDMPERMKLERGMDWLLDRQKELYQEHQTQRESGDPLSVEAEQELDDINHALLELSHVLEKYKPEE